MMNPNNPTHDQLQFFKQKLKDEDRKGRKNEQKGYYFLEKKAYDKARTAFNNAWHNYTDAQQAVEMLDLLLNTKHCHRFFDAPMPTQHRGQTDVDFLKIAQQKTKLPLWEYYEMRATLCQNREARATLLDRQNKGE